MLGDQLADSIYVTRGKHEDVLVGEEGALRLDVLCRQRRQARRDGARATLRRCSALLTALPASATRTASAAAVAFYASSEPAGVPHLVLQLRVGADVRPALVLADGRDAREAQRVLGVKGGGLNRAHVACGRRVRGASKMRTRFKHTPLMVSTMLSRGSFTQKSGVSISEPVTL